MNTSKIGIVNGVIMIVVAALVDLTQVFLLGAGALGIIADIPAAILFAIWLNHCRVSLARKQRILKYLGTIGLEAVPLINDVPWWTITIASTVWQEWHTPEMEEAV